MGQLKHVYAGAFAYCKSAEQLDVCPSGAIGVGQSGTIEFIERDVGDVSSVLEKHGWNDAEIIKIRGHGFFFPGFIGK